MQRAQAVFIDRISQHVPVKGKMSALDIPGMIGQISGLLASEIDVSDPLEFAVTITGDIDPMAIGTEADWAIGDFWTTFWSEQSLLTAADIGDPQITLVNRDLFHGQQFLILGRPIGDLPTPALILNQQMVR